MVYTAQVGVPGWRDLGQTKWRLTKGDEQLDFTYRTTDPPHHISDEPISELSVCIYLVRYAYHVSDALFCCFLLCTLKILDGTCPSSHKTCLPVPSNGFLFHLSYQQSSG